VEAPEMRTFLYDLDGLPETRDVTASIDSDATHKRKLAELGLRSVVHDMEAEAYLEGLARRYEPMGDEYSLWRSYFNRTVDGFTSYGVRVPPEPLEYMNRAKTPQAGVERFNTIEVWTNPRTGECLAVGVIDKLGSRHYYKIVQWGKRGTPLITPSKLRRRRNRNWLGTQAWRVGLPLLAGALTIMMITQVGAWSPLVALGVSIVGLIFNLFYEKERGRFAISTGIVAVLMGIASAVGAYVHYNTDTYTRTLQVCSLEEVPDSDAAILHTQQGGSYRTASTVTMDDSPADVGYMRDMLPHTRIQVKAHGRSTRIITEITPLGPGNC